MADQELTQLSEHPRFRQLVASYAQSNPHSDPVERVRGAVHHAVSQMIPGRERELSDRAAQHAHAALQAHNMAVREGGGAGGSHIPLLASARLANDGHHYVPDPQRKGKFLKVVPKGGVENPTSRLAHTQETAGATPASATNSNVRDLLLIRHGETDMNESATSGNSVDKIRGHTDIPLNEAGKQQAALTGEQLSRSGVKPDAVVTSDLCRAKLTAQIIAQHLGVPINEVSDHFRPWDAGKLTGQKSEKAVPIMAQFAQHAPNQKLPGGESFNAFRTRFFVGLANALQKHQGLLAVVSHHRNERLLHAWQAAGFPADGSIDTKTFNKKGEATGKAQHFKIPVDRAIAAARYGQQTGAAAGEPGNFDAAKQNERPGQE
jgi:broad specificity phosphatase PhoE